MTDEIVTTASAPADLRSLVATLASIDATAPLEPAALDALTARLLAARSGTEATRARCALAVDAGRKAVAMALRVIGLSSLADDVLEGAATDLATVKRLRRTLGGADSQVNDVMTRALKRGDQVALARCASASFAVTELLEAVEAVMVKNVGRAIENAANAVNDAAGVNDSPEVLLRQTERARAIGEAAKSSGAARFDGSGGIEIVGAVNPHILDGNEHSADQRRGYEGYRDALVELLSACCEV